MHLKWAIESNRVQIVPHNRPFADARPLSASYDAINIRSRSE
jgi:hypothetical protein